MSVDAIQALAKLLNFTVRQENGCRTFGPRRDLQNFRPDKGSEVFVAKLPLNAYEDEIYPFFSRAGQIYKIKMILNINSTTKGFCFVEFVFPESAKRAVRILSNTPIRPGHNIMLELSTDHRTLMLTGTNFKVTTEQLLQDLRMNNVQGVVAANQTVVAENRVFLLEFQEHRLAMVALKVIPPVMMKLWGPSSVLQWEPNLEVMRRQERKLMHQQRRMLRETMCMNRISQPLSVEVQGPSTASIWSPDSGLGSLVSNGKPSSGSDSSGSPKSQGEVVNNPDIGLGALNLVQELPISPPWYRAPVYNTPFDHARAGNTAHNTAFNSPAYTSFTQAAVQPTANAATLMKVEKFEGFSSEETAFEGSFLPPRRQIMSQATNQLSQYQLSDEAAVQPIANAASLIQVEQHKGFSSEQTAFEGSFLPPRRQIMTQATSQLSQYQFSDVNSNAKPLAQQNTSLKSEFDPAYGDDNSAIPDEYRPKLKTEEQQNLPSQSGGATQTGILHRLSPQAREQLLDKLYADKMADLEVEAIFEYINKMTL